MTTIYTTDHLKKALKADKENVAAWGAYHLLALDDESLKTHLHDFLQSPFIDIQEAGVARISASEMTGFTPDVLKIFREAEGPLKYSAALALGDAPNDLSKRLLRQWFEQVMQSEQSTRMELDNAVYSLLKASPEAFAEVLKRLQNSPEEGIQGAILLYNLLAFAEKAEDFKQIFDEYFILRDLHNDVELTYQLLDYFEQVELINWLADYISQGYSIFSIYEQCYILLGETLRIEEKHYLEEISRLLNNIKSLQDLSDDELQLLLKSVAKSVELVSQRYPQDGKLIYYRSLVDAFVRHSELFLKSIPKIVDFEYYALLSLPLQILVEYSLKSWLSHPTAYLERIANYYNSTLLTGLNREKILGLFFADTPSWKEEDVRIQEGQGGNGSNLSRNEALWDFYRGKYLGQDINWPIVFPNPSYSFRLPEGLFKVYCYNFDYYVSRQDQVAIDYALKLFQLNPDKVVFDVINRHFDYLVRFHSDLLLQTLELLPHPDFIGRLAAYYRPHEPEIAQLILFMCDIFAEKVPDNVAADLDKDLDKDKLNWRKRVRLNCKNCEHSFQYPVDMVFVDEKAIQQKLPLTNEMIWVPQRFNCKNCGADVDFELSAYQLEELSQQTLVDQLLKNTPGYQNTRLRQKIIPIEFPRVDQITYNPGQFEKVVQEKEKQGGVSSKQLFRLYIRQARIYKSMRLWHAALDVLRKAVPPESQRTEWFFLKGLCHYKLSQWSEAREAFNWLVKNIGETEGCDGSYREQASYFLSEMDSEKSRRSRFKIIEGKKC